jgi:hypothetical protein
MDSLRKDLILFRTAKPSSELFKLKFGDWLSIKQLLQSAAASFETDSNEAKRLQELSFCADSKAPVRFNMKEVSHLTKKVFDIVQNEFFPDLPPENEEIWNALRADRHAANLQDHSRIKRLQDPNNAGERINHQSIEKIVICAEPAALMIASNSQPKCLSTVSNVESRGFGGDDCIMDLATPDSSPQNSIRCSQVISTSYLTTPPI